MDTPGAHLEHLRDYNESLVVALARARAEFDRAGVAEATGLTPQAVSKVLGRLVEHGLVEICGVRRQGVGKPASIYRLVPGSRQLGVLGVVVVEIKSVAAVLPVYQAQLLTYMRLTDCSVDLLINFNVKLLIDGVVRRVI